MRSAWLVSIGFLACAAGVAALAPQAPCRVYDPDPQHPWNRLHSALFMRVGPDGRVYGEDRLDPLYWETTRHLLTGDSHHTALQTLDEFLSGHGERLIRDPLKRAFLQHDLWALFDWTTGDFGGERYALPRRELQSRLATLMRRLALSPQEIAALPQNYPPAQAGDSLPTLPRGLFDPHGEWVSVSTVSGDGVAPQHRADFGGRSVFQVWLRLPEGRAQAISYLQHLRAEALVLSPALPQFPPGTEWALVRRMCLIDTRGEIECTALVESIQLRRYEAVPAGSRFTLRDRQQHESAQQVFEFQAERARGGDLREVRAGERDFFQFRSAGGDPFEERRAAHRTPAFRESQGDVLGSCPRCHSGGPGIYSVQSFARVAGNPEWLRPPELIESDGDRETAATESWKRQQYDFGLLQGLWAGR
jgi:hypothetical protein